jgi:hypothetical protein
MVRACWSCLWVGGLLAAVLASAGCEDFSGYHLPAVGAGGRAGAGGAGAMGAAGGVGGNDGAAADANAEAAHDGTADSDVADGGARDGNAGSDAADARTDANGPDASGD